MKTERGRRKRFHGKKTRRRWCLEEEDFGCEWPRHDWLCSQAGQCCGRSSCSVETESIQKRRRGEHTQKYVKHCTCEWLTVLQSRKFCLEDASLGALAGAKAEM